LATDKSGTVIPLHQPKRPKTPAERARAYRARKREKAGTVAAVTPPSPVPSVPVTPPVTSRVTKAVTPSRRPVGSILLTVAAFGLTGVGLTMNGWFSHGLGSSSVAGWLFFGVGVAADLVALAVPTCAAGLWQARRRGTALAGWAVWAATFVFVALAGIGFASVNISDVTASRASRVTPAVTMAQTAYADAMTARDRECKGGVGRYCREREAAVSERRQALDAALRTVSEAADPQTDAARKLAAWLSMGVLRPSGDDFAMLRLVLLALLPQVGGILLMVARPPK
jgi:hypothetical protein